jgi:hypothetical protein
VIGQPFCRDRATADSDHWAGYSDLQPDLVTFGYLQMEISPQDRSAGPVDEEQFSGSPHRYHEYDHEDPGK